VHGTPENLNCTGWKTTGSDGLIVGIDGSFTLDACSNAYHVACCSLIPVPEPPLAILGGSGAAGLALLAKTARAKRASALATEDPVLVNRISVVSLD
jgi:hypothetical protein